MNSERNWKPERNTMERRHMADRVQGNEAEREGKNNFDDHTISAIIKSADMV